jgi:hypothetical protein
MTAIHQPTERLFSYGTPQLAPVQLSTFGRLLIGAGDSLPDFERLMLPIEDPTVAATLGQTHYAMAHDTGRATAAVSGTAFELTADELQSADKYEIDEYARVQVSCDRESVPGCTSMRATLG